MATPKNQHTTHDEDWNRPPTQYLLQGTRGANETQSAETSSGLEEHPDVAGPKWLDGRKRDETAGEELQRGKRDQYQQSEETTPGGDEQRVAQGEGRTFRKSGLERALGDELSGVLIGRAKLLEHWSLTGARSVLKVRANFGEHIVAFLAGQVRERQAQSAKEFFCFRV